MLIILYNTNKAQLRLIGIDYNITRLLNMNINNIDYFNKVLDIIKSLSVEEKIELLKELTITINEEYSILGD